tara:strand:+ start:591 stop:746 length:156 start_codon:yes stop_codon:yes gene_type:complete
MKITWVKACLKNYGKKLKVGFYNGDGQDELLFYGSVDNIDMSIGIHRSCTS